MAHKSHSANCACPTTGLSCRGSAPRSCENCTASCSDIHYTATHAQLGEHGSLGQVAPSGRNCPEERTEGRSCEDHIVYARMLQGETHSVQSALLRIFQGGTHVQLDEHGRYLIEILRSSGLQDEEEAGELSRPDLDMPKLRLAYQVLFVVLHSTRHPVRVPTLPRCRRDFLRAASLKHATNNEDTHPGHDV